MSDLVNALTDLRQFAKQMKKVISVADALEGVVSLEDQKAELDKEVSALRAERDGLADMISKAKVDAQTLLDQAKQTAESTRLALDEAAAEAAAESAKRVAAADAKAGEVVAAAEQKAASIVAAANAAISSKTEAAAQLDSDIENLTAERGRLEAEVAERQKALDGIKSKLAALAA